MFDKSKAESAKKLPTVQMVSFMMLALLSALSVWKSRHLVKKMIDCYLFISNGKLVITLW